MAKASGQRHIRPGDDSPLHTSFAGYDPTPAFAIEKGQVESGYESLANAMISAARHGASCFAIDGFGGVPWEDFRRALDERCRSGGLELTWRDVSRCLLDDATIRSTFETNLGQDDPLFGHLYQGGLLDFFDGNELETLRQAPIEGPVAFYGCGAALACAPDLLLYVDVPKDVIQRWMREGAAMNVGARDPSDVGATYKRAYFLDWPALNRHKAWLLPHMDVFIDLQDPANPAFMPGDNLRASLDEVATHPFRVRPWFSPGPWGGQWMKRRIDGLDQDVPNYAWSFELIVPENGLVFDGGERLECSFDLLMFRAHERVLGRAAARFGYNFPLRFDYLDTMEGGNLSIQCHPRAGYIKERFGEPFTQDESYYIVACDQDARVYLGFREGGDPAEFRSAAEASSWHGTPIDIDPYVCSFPSRAHDLFLIPSGTIHSSGRGNLVLEISATPYIYTFKIYDWIRRDLDGNLRPLNIERAWDNLDFDRGESYVSEYLLPESRVLAEEPGGSEVFVGTHDDIFYAVHRLELHGAMTVETDNRCHVLNVVEGEAVIVETLDGRRTRYNNGETFVVPAAAGEYVVESVGSRVSKVVKAFVK